MAYLVDFVRLIVPVLIFTCIIFFSWQWITFFTVFSAFFLDEYSNHSQFSIPTVILKLYIVSPYLHILPQHKQRRIMNMAFIPFQTLMSAIKILTTVARGTLLVQIPRDHSSALVSLDSPETGRTAEVKSLKA